MASSGPALLALLSEPQTALQVHALKALNNSVNLFWAEIASLVPRIEMMCEDQNFPERKLAASLVSQVFYHLEALDDSLKYALSAGDYFDINSHSEYTETLIAKCVDEYVKLRVEAIEQLPRAERETENVKVDSRLESVISRVFQRCFEDSQLHQAIGIAVESQRLDTVSAAIKAADSDAAKSKLIWHCLNLSLTIVKVREFRQRLLKRICALCTEALAVPDSISLCHCLIHLDDATGIAKVLFDLSNRDSDQKLIAYQVAYDIAEIGNYPLQQRVIKALSVYSESTPLTNLTFILSGESSIGFYRQFLYSNAATDLGVMALIKEKVEGRNSVTHCAAIVSHAFMQCGTSRDQFIRDNLDWLARANNWAKMSVTAAFGVIHKDHVQHAHAILKPYLPQEGVQTSAYLKAGALYGLGLIYANRGGDQQTYLEQYLRGAADDEVVQHGSCLALGLNSLSTHSSELYDSLKEILYHDNAVAGEAAGLAMGLVMLGSGSASAIEEMCAYAHETQHEKIIRGLGLGLALIMSGREEYADGLITQLMSDKDYNLRYGGCFTLALAFASTANPSAVKRLLHIAVSDVSVDVRRAAVIALGFVLSCVPERVPKLVSLLCESYSPQVRYGAALAIGIACAGTALRSAIDLLTVLCKDRVDFVRQGAMIGMAMVLIQTTAAQEPDVTVFRSLLTGAIEGKHTDTQTKMGAILAQGILDAGGRNMTIALRSGSTGHRRPAAIAGMAVFVQYWYWYPLLHFFSLTLQPTAIIALNENLSMPAQKIFVSQQKPSVFAYPPKHKPKQEEQVKKMPTAQLSISAKAKAKQMKKKKGAAAKSDAMDIDETAVSAATEPPKANGASPGNVTEEPDHEWLQNPNRVTPAQRKVISCPEGRYVPIKKELYGIVIVKNTRPGEAEELVEIEKPKAALGVGEEEEPQPPAPFTFTR